MTVLVHLRQLEALDFSTGGARDVVDKENATIQCLVAGQAFSRVFVDLICGESRTPTLDFALADNVGSWSFCDAIFLQGPYDSNVADTWMSQEDRFKLCGSDLPPIKTLSVIPFTNVGL